MDELKETLEFIFDLEAKQKIDELIKEGYGYQCLDCGKIYKAKPKEPYDDGHPIYCGQYTREIDMCGCGCDLFTELSEMKCVYAKVEPIDGVIVLKEHNFKFCQCSVGEVWTGKAETECSAEYKILEEYPDRKVYRCLKSGLKLVILKSTKDEIENAGYIKIVWPVVNVVEISVHLRMPLDEAD